MTRLGTALAAAVALLSVTACTGEEPAGGDPTSAPPTTASASPSPTPSAPTIPPEATKHSADGAAAFVKYYISVFNHAEATLETDGIESHTSPKCTSCQRMVQRLEKVREGGGSSGDPNWQPTVTGSQLVNGAFIVTADITSSDFPYRESSNASPGIVKATEYKLLYELGWRSGGWVIDRIVEQELPE
ncbi:hypothetical protein H4N58_11880 [Mumia sp. ZJ1417]|uniref:DUF6318 family protein n=1 Tax=Mumia sp. ZJ1417 TaxID=2708082 RepID=UPI0014217A01|nr:DUF6318 family protein [Mumia sp. ZJ1417]QMW64932.1 hypothetical protein H4N58_11880 [Mumia sp. ZJ1417]